MRVRFGQRTAAEQRQLAEIERRAGDMMARGASGKLCPELWLEPRHESGFTLRTEEPCWLPLIDYLAARLSHETRLLSPAAALPLDVALSRASALGDFARASLRVGFSRGHLLEVVFGLPGGTGSEQESAAAKRLVFDLLGQRRAHTWLGRVSVVPAPRLGPLKVLSSSAPVGGLTTPDLVPTFEAAISGLYAGFPGQPWAKRGALEEWSLFELEPEPAPEYADQDDLVFASTCMPEALKCFLAGLPFASERFTRFGERLFYLKYRSRGTPELRLAERRRLEDRLESALVSSGSGRVVGAGLGVSYAYVHCMLHEVERGLALMAEAGQRCELPRSAWLLPFDSELGAEWLEVWPHSEPPPLAVELE